VCSEGEKSWALAGRSGLTYDRGVKTSLRLGLPTLGAGALFALGCAVDVASEPGTEEAGSTRAIVTITRRAPADAPEDVRADALASFVRLPANADAAGILRAVGLSMDLPVVGECRRRTPGQTVGMAAVTRVELLDAGEVSIAAGGRITTLALRAFPTVTDSIAGVVYTTRDRAAEPLPSGLTYTIAASGTPALGALSAEAAAPSALTGVEIQGTPLSELESIGAERDLGVAWAAGSPGDSVVVVVDGGSAVTECTFKDEAGSGTLPANKLPSAGPATLAVHRLRQARFTDSDIAGGELRFDFELEAPLTIE
jgi:hypothetical protein